MSETNQEKIKHEVTRLDAIRKIDIMGLEKFLENIQKYPDRYPKNKFEWIVWLQEPVEDRVHFDNKVF